MIGYIGIGLVCLSIGICIGTAMGAISVLHGFERSGVQWPPD